MTMMTMMTTKITMTMMKKDMMTMMKKDIMTMKATTTVQKIHTFGSIR